MQEKKEYVWPPEFMRNRKTPSNSNNSKSPVGETVGRLKCRKTIAPIKKLNDISRYECNVVETRAQ